MPANIANSDKPAIYLLDAMSFIFRAYHAMQRQRPMSTKTGLPTAAIFVFVNMLNKLRKDFSPRYLAAVFDVAAPTFRDVQAKAVTTVNKFNIKTQAFEAVDYGGYKANRAEMPQDLAQQLPYIRRALEGYRIPILEYPGFEADDVIGTLAQQAADRQHSVFVVSSDKDMMQLVGEHICILNPTKDNLICDAGKVEEILGVRPEQVVDVMALRGDAIDNIPGAPGIGDKGSVELIKQFGSVEAAIDRADEVKKKTYRESLQNNRATILFSKEMVTIDRNVPVPLRLEEMLVREPDIELCRALFHELEFTTLLKEMVIETDLTQTDYRESCSVEELAEILKKAARNGLAIALDFAPVDAPGATEETAAEEDLPFLQLPPPAPSIASRVGISTEPGAAAVVELEGAALQSFQKELENKELPKRVHDAKTAIRQFATRGVALAGVKDDVMLYSYLLNPTYSSHALPDIVLRYFNRKLSGSLGEAADYSGQLAGRLREEVELSGTRKVYEKIDLPLAPVLAAMETSGVLIDTAVLKEMAVRLGRECEIKIGQIHDLCGHEFNVNSPKQLGDVLFNRMGLPKPLKYGKGKVVSTAVDVLEELAEIHEAPRLVLEYRQLSKLKSTYVEALPLLVDPRTGRVHTTFNQVGTATGRLSSNNPNLQNIPIKTELGREIRAAFIAAPGNLLLSADYSQIELRLMAHFSEDPLLLSAYRSGEDIHTLTASEVFGVPPMLMDSQTRNRAKAVNFGIVYGISPFGLAAQLGIEQKEAKKYIETYFARYRGVRRYIDALLEQTRREQAVRTLFGRVRPIPDINSKNANMRGFAERTAVNTPLQGTAADLIKLAMIRIAAEMRSRNLQSIMTLQVHDELVFEVPEPEIDETRNLVQTIMESVIELKVPLVADVGVGKNWRDLQ